MLTYNVGTFVTPKSSKELRDLVKQYNGKKQISYAKGLTRKQVVKLVNSSLSEKHIIYCPEKDQYIHDYFMGNFLNLSDPLGQLMFDENLNMLGYETIESPVLCFQGGVGLNNNTGEILRGLPPML